MVVIAVGDSGGEGGGNAHEKPDPAEGDGQVPPGTPIDPSEPHDDGQHEKK